MIKKTTFLKMKSSFLFKGILLQETFRLSFFQKKTPTSKNEKGVNKMSRCKINFGLALVKAYSLRPLRMSS